MMKRFLSLTAVSLFISACTQLPIHTSFDRGSPQSLLDASSEVVNIALVSEGSVQDVVQWIDQDQPTKAELYCLESDPICLSTLDTLDLFNVPVQYVPAADNMLTLLYDRVVARDCENRYIDNSINPYNLNHPTFGCSNAVNMVQMVGDKTQFTNPPLLDFRDAEKAVQAQEAYLAPYDLSSELEDDGEQTTGQ